MKKILFLLLTVIGFTMTSCGGDDWTTDPALEHIYYTGFEAWYNKSANDITYTVKKGETVAIPIQFWSERVRSYDVTTFYYVTGSLVRGTDYNIIDANGTTLTPDGNGAFSFVWKQAVKGVQNVYVKAGNKAGTFTLQTADPNSGITITNQDISTTVHNKTNDYEVRIFTQNYKVTVKVE